MSAQTHLHEKGKKGIDMKRAQALKFWKTIHETTNKGDVISQFENKKGYGGKRTLLRWIQADDGFKVGIDYDELSRKTGWKLPYIKKIREWWVSAFPESIRGRYSEEWGHYERIKEAIISLQHVSVEQRIQLLNEIERERVTLGDGKLQDTLNKFIAAIQEDTHLGMTVSHEEVMEAVEATSKRMNNRYQRL